MQISSLFHNTRPEGALLPQEEAAFSLLEKLEIPYDRVSSDPADNMEKCAAASEVLGVPICKNLFFRATAKKRSFICFAWDRISLFTPKDLVHQIGLGPAVLCAGRGTLGTAALHPRLRHHPGINERLRPPGPPSDGTGGLRGRIPELPPLYLYQQPQAQNPGCAGQAPALYRS